MAKKTKPVWETSDGREFPTKGDAERHEKLVHAQRRLAEAHDAYARAMFETQRTADGEPFVTSVMVDYYFVRDPVNGFPSLGRVSFWFGYGGCRLDEDTDEIRIQVIENEGEKNERRTSYCFSELYRYQTNARKALLAKQRERLAELSGRVGQLAQDLGEHADGV